MDYKEVVYLLIEGKGVLRKEEGIDVCLSLHDAACNGDLELVKPLSSEQRADINMRDYGWTALGLANCNGHNKVAKALLEMGTVLMDGLNANHTELQLAAGGGYIAVVGKLLQVGADINAPAGDDHGFTALQAAADKGHIAVVDRLL